MLVFSAQVISPAFLLVTFVTLNLLHLVDSNSNRSNYVSSLVIGPNVCYVQQKNGCKYRIAVLSITCNHGNFAETRNRIQKRGMEGLEEGVEEEKEQEVEVEKTDQQSLKKLEALEQKLVRMMEDLSVRSLRHVREIRSDLRQMTNSMKLLRERNGRAISDDGRSYQLNPIQQQKPQCPSEFIGMGVWRICYRFSNFDASWHEAREYCSALGATLLSIESMKEAYIIDYLIKSHAELQEPKGWWTSGNYVVRSQRWMWSSSASSSAAQHQMMVGFTRWAAGEPNARSTMHCMVLFKPALYHWHDATCTDKYNFVCKLDSI